MELKRLREMREHRKKTQKDLATMLKVTTKTYGNYEMGATNPDIETLIKLSDYFNVSIDELVGKDVKKLELQNMTLKQITVVNKVLKLNDQQCDKLDAYIEGLEAGYEKAKIQKEIM